MRWQVHTRDSHGWRFLYDDNGRTPKIGDYIYLSGVKEAKKVIAVSEYSRYLKVDIGVEQPDSYDPQPVSDMDGHLSSIED